MEVVTAAKIEEKGLAQVPAMTDNPVNYAIKTRLFGQRDIRTDFILLKEFTDLVVTIPALDGMTGDAGYTRTTASHSVQDAVPFVFLQITGGGNFVQVPANYGQQVIGNAHMSDTGFYFDTYNNDSVAVTINIRAFVYELRKKT